MSDVVQVDLSELFPEVIEEPESVLIGMHLIEETPYTAPAALRASMESHGLLQPVILNAPERGARYEIVDGRRRVAAARALGWQHIGAIVYTVDSLVAHTMTVTANTIRSANPLTDLEAIMALHERGYTESDIATATGLRVGTIRKRLKLTRLPDEIMQGVKNGKIALGVAERVASLPDARVHDAVERFTESGKLTGDDVSDITRTGLEAAAAALDDALFADVGTESPDALPSLTGALRDLQRTYEGSVTREEWMRAAAEAWDAS